MIGKTDYDLIGITKLTLKEAQIHSNSDKNVFEANSEIVLPESKFTMPDGETKYFQTIKKPLTLNDNKKVIIGYVIYITEKKNNIKLLEKKQKKLQELIITKDKFFSIIAHDLKNPFGTTMNFAQLLLQYYHKNSDEKNLRFISNIYKGAKQAFNLLENLLEWSLTQSNRIEFNPTIFNLSTVIDKNIDFQENKAEEKGIKIFSEIKDKVQVYADIDMINTVIRNLLSNALKFTNKNGEIYIKGSEGKNSIKISISDTGIGIKPKVLKTIFRIDDSYSTQGIEGELGTGLGLILCKEFVEKNSGKIWVESELAKGSTFSFTLPFKKE
ncbi:MAG: HAMP domain-containing sensor histidine kinase [Bacteroidales bacterium]|jgi:two-component system sensor histidine kinase/response regulator|nr:HAMP domain-containing sensor histidine kinase [Bacteroidales bacterium]